MFQYFAALTLTAFLGFMAGCAEKTIAMNPNRNPAEEIARVGTEIKTARQVENLDLLSPQHYKDAVSEYNDAVKIQTSSSEENKAPEILKRVDESSRHLQMAKQSGHIARLKLGAALEEKSMAERALDEAGAARGGLPGSLTKDYDKAERDFVRETENFEDGYIGGAEGTQADLINKYSELERRSVNYHYASPSSHTINSAVKEGAKKWAPGALSSSFATNKALVNAINANPRNTAAISELARSADESAASLLASTRENKYLASLSPSERARVIREKEQAAREQQLEQNRRIASLNRQAQSERRYLAATGMLPADQADVYRRGEQLVIRLKGLGFETGKAEIPKKSEELLGKVGQVISSYEPGAQVTIFGQTDSTGTPAINGPLSKKRAEVVKDYLVKTSKIPESNIQTKGMADTEPLASNKTASGRKANRRVDVVIIEGQQPS